MMFEIHELPDVLDLIKKSLADGDPIEHDLRTDIRIEGDQAKIVHTLHVDLS